MTNSETRNVAKFVKDMANNRGMACGKAQLLQGKLEAYNRELVDYVAKVK